MQISGKHLSLITALLFLVTMTYIPSLFAETDEVRKVASVEVSGNRYVESAAILANVRSKAGEPFSKKQISRDVRALFATGYFEDVYVEGFPEAEGTRLVYVVKENPLIASLDIQGNSEVTDKDLKPRLELKPGRVFSAAKLRKDRNTIRKGYLKEGYYQVDVTVEKSVRDDGRIDLIMNVSEGDITHIKSINFIGNSAYTDKTLRNEIASRKSDFWSFFSDRDVFDRERFGGDAQMLQQFYQNHGYLDMKIESSQLSLTPDKKSFYLMFSVYEGPQYYIDQIDIQGDLVPSREALMARVKLERDDIYSVSALRDSIAAMEELVGDQGYAFANVTPLFKRDAKARRVSISFDIEKGKEVYVQRIEVSGNDKTTDSVVRRELRQFEAERFSASGVKRSKERLQRSRLFKDVRVNLAKTEESDRVRMNVEVEEEKTGSFSVGVGHSQLQRMFVSSKLEERNFLGKGYTTNLSAEVGATTQNFNASIYDPYFFSSDIGASLNVFKTQTKLGQQVTNYKQDDYGAGVGLNIPITEDLTYSIGYQFKHSNLSDIVRPATLILLSQEGVQTTGELNQSITWDTRDKTIAATQGHIEELGVSVAGLGGQNKFYELHASSQSYFSIAKGYVFSPSFNAKSINGFAGKSLPIYRRYSLGGVGSLRGFDSLGVSMRDPATGEVIGGDKQVNASLNLFFPLPYMETEGFRGVLFVDAGTIWGDVNTTVGAQTFTLNEKFSTSRIRSSYGIGLEWLSPVGPISLAWGFPIHKVQGDLTRNFEFAVGASF